ncbi:hypothetical protein like AT3G27330 [Hibiscus trionum]|uniref:RING-type E3 ubiquitin transferase n=1 Tax=Hibiscus trionum TaxID=183268 RepID=A0A9W7GXZ4_HIBTR|nr:hypothetical protein like AT3G27330 [Hibiscus trionum]
MTIEEPKQAESNENTQNVNTLLFSPRFKSAAAMAGWDEETLIIATLVVEDTPDRQSKHKKRSDFVFKTPPSANSRRKRRAKRRSPVSTHIAPFNLNEEEDTSQQESKAESMEQRIDVKDEKKTELNEPLEQAPDVSCSSPSPAFHCMDKLREELSCAICLDICFEPSTTPCGHSFCKKCLRSAADKCGKRCPKCRQLIRNGISCAVNTVLWNTIQLLFPNEVSEARKSVAGALNSREVECRSPESGRRSTRRTRSVRPPTVSARDDALALRLQREDLSRLESADDSSLRRGRRTLSQDEDATLALRLQREQFMESFRGNHRQTRTPTPLSLAINIRRRGRPV